MYFTVTIALLGFLVITSGLKTIDIQTRTVKLINSCGLSHNVTPAEVFNIEETLKNPSNDFLCFMKCIVERDDSMDENGRIKLDNLDVFFSEMQFDNVEILERVKECFINIPVIKECKDMIPYSECLFMLPDL